MPTLSLDAPIHTAWVTYPSFCDDIPFRASLEVIFNLFAAAIGGNSELFSFS